MLVTFFLLLFINICWFHFQFIDWYPVKDHHKIKLWQYSNSNKNLNYENSSCAKSWIVIKLKLLQNLNCDKTLVVKNHQIMKKAQIVNLKLWKPQLWANSKFDKTQNVTSIFGRISNEINTNEMYSGSHLWYCNVFFVIHRLTISKKIICHVYMSTTSIVAWWLNLYSLFDTLKQILWHRKQKNTVYKLQFWHVNANLFYVYILVPTIYHIFK